MGKLLTAAQVEQYHRDGILFPVPVLSPGETARFRAAFEDVAARLGGRPVAQALGHTHAYFRWAYDLATHPRILDAVEDVLGPDLLVWTVSIFPKYPRDPGYKDHVVWDLSLQEPSGDSGPGLHSPVCTVAVRKTVDERGCLSIRGDAAVAQWTVQRAQPTVQVEWAPM